MTTRDKLFTGLEGLGELIAQRDITLLRRYCDGDNKENPDDIREDHCDLLKIKETFESVKSFIDIAK